MPVTKAKIKQWGERIKAKATNLPFIMLNPKRTLELRTHIGSYFKRAKKMLALEIGLRTLIKRIGIKRFEVLARKKTSESIIEKIDDKEVEFRNFFKVSGGEFEFDREILRGALLRRIVDLPFWESMLNKKGIRISAGAKEEVHPGDMDGLVRVYMEKTPENLRIPVEDVIGLIRDRIIDESLGIRIIVDGPKKVDVTKHKPQHYVFEREVSGLKNKAAGGINAIKDRELKKLAEEKGGSYSYVNGTEMLIVNANQLSAKEIGFLTYIGLKRNAEEEAAVDNCYKIVNKIKDTYRQIKKDSDYIMFPRGYGYQSYHIMFESASGPVELQIRTRNIDRKIAEADNINKPLHWKIARRKTVRKIQEALRWPWIEEKQKKR